MVLMQSNYEKIKKGDKAPNFSLKGTDGNDFNLTYLKGKKATLVIFMCNHCPYVIPEIEKINKIASDFRNVTVIGINPNNNPDYPDDSFENMKKMVEEKRFRFYYLFDEHQKAAKDYNATCTPDPFLFDKDLNLIYHGRLDEMYEIIEEFLGSGEITQEEIPSQGCSIKWVD